MLLPGALDTLMNAISQNIKRSVGFSRGSRLVGTELTLTVSQSNITALSEKSTESTQSSRAQ